MFVEYPCGDPNVVPVFIFGHLMPDTSVVTGLPYVQAIVREDTTVRVQRVVKGSRRKRRGGK